jgi:hypothetical protein
MDTCKVSNNLIKIVCLLDLYFFGDILISNNIPFWVMSYNLSFIFDCPIICKTVKYIDQSDNISWQYSVLIPKDLVGSSLISQLKILTCDPIHDVRRCITILTLMWPHTWCCETVYHHINLWPHTWCCETLVYHHINLDVTPYMMLWDVGVSPY